MKKKHETLYRSRGIVDALFWLPTSRKVKGEELDRVFSWQLEYHTNGLPLSRMGEDNRALRRLVEDGYLSIMGKGRATGHRVTAKGLRESNLQWAMDPSEVLLSKVKPLQEIGNSNSAGFIHGWKLVPSAYKATFEGGSIKKYNLEHSKVEKWLLPAQQMGWLHMYANGNGCLWSVALTEAGEGAIANAMKRGSKPEAEGVDIDGELKPLKKSTQAKEQEPEVDEDAAADLWVEGFENIGPRFFRETPEPAWQANAVRRRLSEGGGWEDGE